MKLVLLKATILFPHPSYVISFCFLISPPCNTPNLFHRVLYLLAVSFPISATYLLLPSSTLVSSSSLLNYFLFPPSLLLPPGAPFPRLSLPRPRSTRPPQIKPALCVFHGGFCVQMAKNCKTSKQVWLVRRPVKCRPPYTQPGFEIKCFTTRLRHTGFLSYCIPRFSIVWRPRLSILMHDVGSVLCILTTPIGTLQTHVFSESKNFLQR